MMRLGQPIRKAAVLCAAIPSGYKQQTFGWLLFFVSSTDALRASRVTAPRLRAPGGASCPSPADPGGISKEGERPLFGRFN